MVTFGGYELPGVEMVERPRASRRRSATPANWRGEYSLGTIPAAREITVRGYVMGATWQLLDAAWDAFNGALAEGPAKVLSLSEGRFYFAEVASVTEVSSNLIGAINYEVVFYVPDPYEYATPAGSADLGTVGAVVAVGGVVAAEPTLTLVVSGANGVGTIAVTNAAQGGRTFILTPSEVGTYTADSRTQRVLRGAIAAEGEASGELLLLHPGNNAISIATEHGGAITGATLTWNDTYRT